MKNYYQTLGVSPSATFDEIKAAYKKLSKQVHPDMNWGEKVFEDIFKHVNEAYQVLSDEVQRRDYNRRYNHFFFSSSCISPVNNIQVNPIQEVYPPANNFRRKVFINSGICALLIFAFLGVNAFVFTGDENFNNETTIASLHAKSENEQASENKLPVADIKTQNKAAAAATLKVRNNKIEAATSIPATIAMATKTNEQPVTLVKPTEKLPLQSSASLIKAVEKITWSNDEMIQVVKKIMAEKMKAGSKAHSVQLVQSANSNVENGLAVSQLLRENNFSIAGRLTSPNTSAGLQVHCSGDVIVVTIGLMEP